MEENDEDDISEVGESDFELNESDDEIFGSKKKPKKKKKKMKKKKKTSRQEKRIARKKTSQYPSLSKLLLDENVERLGLISSYAEFKDEMEKPDFLSTFVGKSSRPQLPICPITLLPAVYRDPESSIPYRNGAAFQSLKENPPSWTKGPISQSPFLEAKKIIQLDKDNLLKTFLAKKK